MTPRIGLAVAASFLLAMPAAARVDYAIDLKPQAEHHTGLVSIAFPRATGPYLDVKMPAWRSGRYNILNLANGVRGFQATDAAGRPLAWTKIDKSTWRISLPQATAVKVRYEVYGNELGLRVRHIDDSHAYLNASGVFLYADRFKGEDVSVALDVPADWKSVSGMASPAPNRFTAANYDVLADSPIETGRHQRFSFTEGGRPYDVVFWGEGNYDTAKTVADLKKIVAQAPTIWSGFPFQRYLFIVHATDGVGGATEHLNSTVIQIPRDRFASRAGYLGFLSTAAHEFIHTWNVKAYRGAGLVPYDYERENYDPTLWIAEGSTEYFSPFLLLSAGIATPEEFRADFANLIGSNQRRAGTAVQSVAEASFDEWISASGDRAQNAQVNIYDQGALTSLKLDMALLDATDGRVGYREVHDQLYRRFPAAQGRGFTPADVRRILAELTGRSWDGWWATHVDRPIGQPDWNAVLAPVGLKLGGDLSPKPFAGWVGAAGVGGVRLASVERGSPAWNAGFTVDDVVVAIDGRRATPERFDALLAERRIGERVAVSYFRRDRLETKAMVIGGAPGRPSVVPVANPTERQVALYRRWTRTDGRP